jgi:hypothetical protein
VLLPAEVEIVLQLDGSPSGSGTVGRRRRS